MTSTLVRPLRQRTIGILGGMSNQATGEYYRLLNEGLNARLGGWDNGEIVVVFVNFGNVEHFVRRGEWEAARRYLADKVDALERAGTDVVLCLRVLTGVHREHLPEQGGGCPIRHQGRELGAQPIQLRGRADKRRPCHACLGRGAAGTAEAGQADRDLAEQRRDLVPAIVLHSASGAAVPARRTAHGMNPGLRGDDLPLDARQHQLCFGQGQTQIGDVDEAIGPADLHDIRARPLAFPKFHQPQNPSHAPTLGQRTDADIPRLPSHPQSRDGP